MSIRVVVAADRPLLRGGVSALLDAQPGIAVVAQADTAEHAVKAAAEYRPEVVLLDLRMRDLDQVDAVRRVVATGSDSAVERALRVAALTGERTVTLVSGVLRAGASGLVRAEADPWEVIGAVRAVAAGGVWLDPAIVRELMRELSSQPVSGQRTGDLVRRLTARECEVLELMAGGFDNAEIARRLFVSASTVRTHVGRVLHKLDCGTRTQAVVTAYRSGLVRVRPAA